MGAEVNIPCRHGGTPLHTVVSLYPECVALLIQVGQSLLQGISQNLARVSLFRAGFLERELRKPALLYPCTKVLL